MSASLISTEVVSLDTGTSNPAAVNITIPTDCTAVYVFWSFYSAVGDGGFSAVTLNGFDPDQSFEFGNVLSSQWPATGVNVWYNPATGSRSLDYLWHTVAGFGPVCIVAYVKDGDLASWTDADAQGRDSSNNASITLDTVVGDLLLKLDSRFNDTDPPAAGSGWTSQNTQARNTRAGRLSSKTAGSTSEVINTEDDQWSTVVAVAIGSSAAPTLTQSRFRWRNDDGSETGATWAAAENANITVAAGTPKRLRVQVQSTGDKPSASYKLQFRKVGDPGWQDVN